MSAFSLGKVFGALGAGIENPRVGKTLTPKEMTDLANQAWSSFRRDPYPELLSCFAPGRLVPLVGLQVTEDDGGFDPRMDAAVTVGDRTEVYRIMLESMAFALYTLLQNPRSEIHQILVVDEFPPEAQREYLALRARFEKPEVQPAPASPAVAPVVQVDPIDQCVADFRGPNCLRSDVFKTKYLDDRNGRKVYDAAVAAGRI